MSFQDRIVGGIVGRLLKSRVGRIILGSILIGIGIYLLYMLWGFEGPNKWYIFGFFGGIGAFALMWGIFTKPKESKGIIAKSTKGSGAYAKSTWNAQTAYKETLKGKEVKAKITLAPKKVVLTQIYTGQPLEKIVSSARWGLESNGLEITDHLNPEAKTTKLIGVKPKWGTAEVLIIDKTPEIAVQVKPNLAKSTGETEFLTRFWEKLEVEAGIQKTDVQRELDILRQGDYSTYHMTEKANMDMAIDQARWGLEDMGLKIAESLRPDPMNASLTGVGRIGKKSAEARVIMKGHNNDIIVQLSHSLKIKPTDILEINALRSFWEKFNLQFGTSLEEEEAQVETRKTESAEDIEATIKLTEIWETIVHRDTNLNAWISSQETDPNRIESILGPLKEITRKYISWPVISVFQRGLVPSKSTNAPYLLDLSYIKVENVPAHPALFTFARLGPYPITKDLQITDKLTFSYQGMDFTDELGRSLREIEEPILAKPLKSAYSDATLTHYKAEISGKERDGSEYSKFLDYLLAEPIRIFNILVGDSEHMVVMARAFLSPDGRIAPLPSAFVRLMDQLVTDLDRYCTKPRPTNTAVDEAQPAINVALNRCPFCNWLLSPGISVCPMCRKELPTREADFIPPPPPPKPTEAELGQPKIVEPPPLAATEQPLAPSSTEGLDQRIQEINYQITALQGVLNDLQSAFTSGSIKFEQYQVSNDQYIQQIGKLQEEKRALERKKFESFKL